MPATDTTLAELARMVGGELFGDPGVKIYGLADLASAGAGQISFLVNEAHREELYKSKATAFFVPPAIPYEDRPLIKVRSPYLAAALTQNFFHPKIFKKTEISPKAHIGAHCEIPEEISIGPFVAIGDRVRLGSRITIYPGVTIADDVVIGDDTIIYANVSIYHSCTIGARVIIHSGAVIGSDGFGFATEEKGSHVKWQHTGTVQIEDDVEIGANTTIDRATFGKTHIMEGTKIDNLVQVGHNVKIGANSLIVAQVGIAGSTSLGRNVVLGGQAGLKGHIYLDDNTIVAAKSGVHSSLKKGAIVSGYPAIPHKEWLKASIIFARLPKIHEALHEIQREIKEIREELNLDKDLS